MTRPLETCEVCGNTYDKTFQVTLAGVSHTFDSFECAIHALAPVCNHCGCRILGHGSENEQGVLFCSAFCARESGIEGIRDRVLRLDVELGHRPDTRIGLVAFI